MIKITETFNIDKEASNPLFVKATIEADYDYPSGWDWEVKEIHYVELIVGDKEGIDITKQVLNNPRALALINSQVGECEDAIYSALGEKERVA